MIPIEVDMERVERSRKLGVLRLGQPLKSFRDHLGDFTIYQPGAKHEYLESLGPLNKPSRVDELARLQIKDEQISEGQPPSPSIPKGLRNGF